MPSKPPHPCAAMGCPEVLSEGATCEKHRRATRAPDTRPSAAARGYDGRHRNWRLLILHRDPICRVCKKEESLIADHIIPLRDGGTWALTNGQGLCRTCDNRKKKLE